MCAFRGHYVVGMMTCNATLFTIAGYQDKLQVITMTRLPRGVSPHWLPPLHRFGFLFSPGAAGGVHNSKLAGWVCPHTLGIVGRPATNGRGSFSGFI